MVQTEPMTIVETLRQSAAKFGQQPALWQRRGNTPETISFEALLRRSETIAAGLRSIGLETGDRVALIGENSIDWSLMFFGTLLAGGIAVPIYYRLSADEQRTMLEIVKPRFVAAQPAILQTVPHLRSVEKILVLGENAPFIGGESSAMPISELELIGPRPASPLSPPSPDDTAVILFTSGTFGPHKGVRLTHRNITSNAWAVSKVVHVGPDDTLLLVLPMHHPFPLTAGLITALALGTLTAFENELPRLRERMAELRPTVFFGVPELYRMLLKTIRSRAEAEGQGRRLNSGMKLVSAVKRVTGVNIGPLVFRTLHKRFGGRIRFLASGGAALPSELVLEYSRLGFLLVQGWGLTEASPVLAAPNVDDRAFRLTRIYEEHAGAIGLPLPGVRLKLVDVPEKGIFVEDGNGGEIVASGPNITPGYFENSAETNLAFFEDAEGRWFRTGDIGRFGPDGWLYLTGRVKSLIVLDSGEKVNPDEVEDALRENPLIREVVVFECRPERPESGSKAEIHAIVYPDREAILERVLAQQVEPTAELIANWVEAAAKDAHQHLARFKRVHRIRLTDRPLPQTPLGKIRRGLVSSNVEFDLDRFLASSD